MDRIVVHVCGGILLHEKEWIWVSWTEVDEPEVCYTDWSQSEREKQILYIKAYIWNLEKNGTDEPICRAGIETQMYRTDLWTKQEEEGGWDELRE